MLNESVAAADPAVNPEPDDVANGMRLGNAILHATRRPAHLRVAYVGRTVRQFVEALVALGVSLDDALGSIDYGGGAYAAHGYVAVERDDRGAWEVREVKL